MKVKGSLPTGTLLAVAREGQLVCLVVTCLNGFTTRQFFYSTAVTLVVLVDVGVTLDRIVIVGRLRRQNVTRVPEVVVDVIGIVHDGAVPGPLHSSCDQLSLGSF